MTTITSPASQDNANIARLIERMARKPEIKEIAPEPSAHPLAFIPDGDRYQVIDLEKYLRVPTRIRANPKLHDLESFINYIERHSDSASSIYCDTNLSAFQASYAAVIDDNDTSEPAWREHVAKYEPLKSHEWTRWAGKNGHQMSQVEFALFIEDNLKDIATIEGMPNSGQMMQMALGLDIRADKSIKSAVRLQSGGVELTYVNRDDAGTSEKMSVFEKFAIGIPVFFNGDSYQMTARLRYRTKDSAVVFWFELLRPDLIFADAVNSQIKILRERTELPLFMGTHL